MTATGADSAAVPPDEALILWRFDDCEFDPAALELRVAGRLVPVEPRPLQVLDQLLRHCNEVVSRDELLESVWDGRPTVDHVLANAVSKLRTALGAQAASRLQTVPRVGYRLLGPVQRALQQVPAVELAAGQPWPGARASCWCGPCTAGPGRRRTASGWRVTTSSGTSASSSSPATARGWRP
jgi:non-specific serine/threonine protein kinase